MLLRTLIASIFLLVFSLPSVAKPIDINHVNADILAKVIQGVGPSRAIAIVEYRTNHGPFKSIDDLTNVKGIGEKTLEANRHLLTVIADPEPQSQTP